MTYSSVKQAANDTQSRQSAIEVSEHSPRHKVVVIDDSLVVRAILERLLNDRPEFDVVATFPGAGQAQEYVAVHDVDIIILDIEMPCGNGLDAMPGLLSVSDARILVLSSLAEEGGPAAVKALSLGACDTLVKPGRNSFAGNFGNILVNKLQKLGRSTTREFAPDRSVLVRPIIDNPDMPECIAIGSSTGGIPATQKFLGALDDAIDCPVLLTQHLPENFMPFLVRQLGDYTSRKVVLARDGMRLQRSHIYVAPGDAHMTVRHDDKGVHLALIYDDSISRYVPSVDPMLSSLAIAYGAKAIAVILSGMGRDGLIGAEDMSDAGASIYAQDPGSSVVWGMPGVVVRAGLATAILPAEQIGSHISRIVDGVHAEGVRP